MRGVSGLSNRRLPILWYCLSVKWITGIRATRHIPPWKCSVAAPDTEQTGDRQNGFDTAVARGDAKASVPMREQQCKLGTIDDAELAEYRREVTFHRLLRNGEMAGDAFVTDALTDESRDFAFSWR
jgi:hypothetical protein